MFGETAGLRKFLRVERAIPVRVTNLRRTNIAPPSDWVPVKVKWYNSKKGFGFLSQGTGTPDIFLHASVLEPTGYTELADGQVIQARFGMNRRNNKLQATEVKIK